MNSQFPEMFLTDQAVRGKWISAKSKARPKEGQFCRVITFDGNEYLGLYCPQLSKDGNGAFSIGSGIVFWLSVVAWKICE